MGTSESTRAQLEIDPALVGLSEREPVDVTSWATTRRAGFDASYSVLLTPIVWNAIESVPLETLGSSDVVQRLYSVLEGAARVLGRLYPQGIGHSDTVHLGDGVEYGARLQTETDGPSHKRFQVFLRPGPYGSLTLTIDLCGPTRH